MTKKCLLNLVILFLTTFSFSQHKFGVKLNVGIFKLNFGKDYNYLANPSLHKYVADPGNTGIYPNKYQQITLNPSAQIGMFYNWKINKLSGLGMELLYTQLGYNTTTAFKEIEYIEKWIGAGQIDGHEYIYYSDSIISKSSIPAISIPIYYNLVINKLSVNIGIQMSFITSLVKNTRHFAKNSYTFDGGSYFQLPLTKTITPLNTFNIGPRIGFSYNLFNKFEIEGTYFFTQKQISTNNPVTIESHMSTNILSEKESYIRIQNISLGIKYNLINKVKK